MWLKAAICAAPRVKGRNLFKAGVSGCCNICVDWDDAINSRWHHSDQVVVTNQKEYYTQRLERESTFVLFDLLLSPLRIRHGDTFQFSSLFGKCKRQNATLATATHARSTRENCFAGFTLVNGLSYIPLFINLPNS